MDTYMCVCCACLYTYKQIRQRWTSRGPQSFRMTYLCLRLFTLFNCQYFGIYKLGFVGRASISTFRQIDRRNALPMYISLSLCSQRMHTVRKIHTDAEYKIYRLINNGGLACILRYFSLRHINNLSCFSFDWQIIEYHGWSDRTVSAVRRFEYAYAQLTCFTGTLFRLAMSTDNRLWTPFPKPVNEQEEEEEEEAEEKDEDDDERMAEGHPEWDDKTKQQSWQSNEKRMKK